MQYYKPDGEWFVGDCMPFSHDGVFHVYYLLDQNHHQGLGGLGGHQWAHVSTRDLVNWQAHPLALPITAEWEGSLCTGSVFHHAGEFHAFYATRRAADRAELLSHAVSRDGITFEKLPPVPFLILPEKYEGRHCRDPFVCADPAGGFHMLLTSKLRDFPLIGRGGCLLHLTSSDLRQWQLDEKPLFLAGCDWGHGCPECADRFEWNGWHYLLFGLGLKTFYRYSRRPDGPWLRPAQDQLDSAFCAVMKTAAFGARRIGVGWGGPRRNQRDQEGMMWGGSMVIRELVQFPDGTLGTKFPAELTPPPADIFAKQVECLTSGSTGDGRRLTLAGPETLEAAAVRSLPAASFIRCRVCPKPGIHRFGLGLRGTGQYEKKYDLTFTPGQQRLALGGESLAPLAGLDRPFNLELALQDDILDVCVDGRQCLINRLPELTGRDLFFWAENGTVNFENLEIQPPLPCYRLR